MAGTIQVRGRGFAMPLSGRRAVPVALGAAVLAALALRVPFLTGQSMWLDEVVTAHVVGGSLGHLWDALHATESTPPLYYLLAWALAKAAGGPSAAALRAVSLAAGALTVPAAFLALRDLVGRRAALGAGWLAAASPLLVWYSLDARAYALLVLLSLVTIWALARLLAAPSPARWAAWSVAAGAAIWTHWFAIFLVAGEAAVLLWRLRGHVRALAAASAGAGVLVAPIVPLLLAQARGDGRTAWISAQPLPSRAEELVRQFAMGPNVPRTALEAAGLALALGGLAAGAVALRRRPGAQALALTAAVAVLVPLVLAAIGIEDLFDARNLLMVWPCAAAIAATGLLRARAVPLAALLAVSVAAVLWSRTDWRYGNEDWRAAARALPAAAAGDPVFVAPAASAPVAERYLGRAPAIGPVDAREVWVVMAPTRSTRALAPTAGSLPPGWPGEGFAPRGERRVHGFRILRYAAPAPGPVAPPALPDGATALAPAR